MHVKSNIVCVKTQVVLSVGLRSLMHDDGVTVTFKFTCTIKW